MSTQQTVKEILEEQLRLLSDRSKVCNNDRDLAELTVEMVEIAEFLLSPR